jgi:hypothetical protein
VAEVGTPRQRQLEGGGPVQEAEGGNIDGVVFGDNR